MKNMYLEAPKHMKNMYLEALKNMKNMYLAKIIEAYKGKTRWKHTYTIWR